MESTKNTSLPSNNIIIAISSMALLSAFIAEYVFGLKPCILCIYERIPYALALLLSLISAIFAKVKQPILTLIAIIFLASMFLCAYHVGVELHIFEATDKCNIMSDATYESLDQLRQEIFLTELPSCDKPAFIFMGISFAGWNLLLSTIMVIFTLYHIFRNRYDQQSTK